MIARGWMVVAAVALAACSSGGGTDAGQGRQPLVIETPTTIVGILDVSVEEGEVGLDDISDVNFGSVELDDGYVLVEIAGDVLRASNVARETLFTSSRFEVSLAGPSELLFDELTPYYSVDTLSPLD
jgi:hypothetical protein